MDASETAERDGTMSSMLRPRCFFVPESGLNNTGTPAANRSLSYDSASMIDIEAGCADEVQVKNTAAEQTRLAYLKTKVRQLYGFLTTKIKGYIN